MVFNCERQLLLRAVSLAFCSDGISIAANIAMIAITTSSSINVKLKIDFFADFIVLPFMLFNNFKIILIPELFPCILMRLEKYFPLFYSQVCDFCNIVLFENHNECG